MAPRAQRLRLLDMQSEVERIAAAVAGLDLVRFRDDWLVRNAVERGLEIISEASRHLSDEAKALEPGIPWRRVADIGNWFRHAYDRVDPALVWYIVVDELPILDAAIARMLAVTSED
jgi:uncharacterized protein with HEPN domain